MEELRQMDKTALITGTTGQDGSYLAELLLSKGYQVYGTIRRSSVVTTERIAHLIGNHKFELIDGDITDATCMNRLISGIQPDEIYNLAAMSHVGVSFDQPVSTCQIDAVGPLNLLEAVRQFAPKARFYQACHDTETKVVTTKGIKRYDEVEVGDYVYSLNETTGKVETKRVSRKFVYDYDGQMIAFRGRGINQLVTPNHMVLLRMDNGEIVRERADKIRTLFGYDSVSGYSIPITGNSFDDSYVSEIKLSELAANEFADNCSANLIDTVNAECLCYLLGIYIGDGYFASSSKRVVKFARRNLAGTYGSHQPKDFSGRFSSPGESVVMETGGKSSYILFAVPESDKAREKLVSCLNKLNLDFRCKKMTVELSCSSLASVFRLCGVKCRDKTIPDFVFGLPTYLQQQVFDGMIDSDGYRREGCSTEYYTTVSDQLASDFIRLCSNLGRNCSYNHSIPEVTSICGHKVNPGKSYAFTIAKKSTNKLYATNIHFVSYNGKVWCLSVEDNHNFLISRGGKLAFSGNSTSELFGDTDVSPQSEETPMIPNSPYAIAKLYAHQMVGLYRRAYGIHACAGILFNHESQRRGEAFVTRKITQYVAMLLNWINCNEGFPKKDIDVPPLALGNIDAKRDWSHAIDMVRGMWMILQHDKPDDYVLGSGETHSVRELLEVAFGTIGLNYLDYVVIDPKFYRPADVNLLHADPAKAEKILGWKPTIGFGEMIDRMVQSDYGAIINA